MSFTVITKTYKLPDVCESEALRYAGCREGDPAMAELLKNALQKTEAGKDHRVCYCVLPVSIHKNVCDLGAFSVKSRALAKNLTGCNEVILFAATVGVEFDRLIARQMLISPAEAIMLDAVGTERVEALCDCFCEDMEKELGKKLAPRFSPGYGDLDIDCQNTVCEVLGTAKAIGVTVSDSIMLSPAKSVTAFVGIKE
ncbi:MAG: hypothetical protein IJ408_03615 [Clostridia bacterium]|nr:hypothetical protein [Clostridia bacterium]